MRIIKHFLTLVILALALTNAVAASAFSESVAKNAALQMTATLENSTTELQFNYAENINDGRGITFGAIGFCTGTYDGNVLIKHYTELNPNNNLAKYIPALNVIDAAPHNDADGDGNDSTVGLSGFVSDVENNTDPLFVQAQLHELDLLYWNPALEIFNSIGAQNNLTMTFIYDMSIRHGADGAQEIVDSVGSSVGSNENTFLSRVIAARDAYLADEGLGDVDRDDGFKQVLNSGNVNLNTPFSFTAYGDVFTIKGATTSTYALTVASGTGDGTYTSGTQVTITANAPAAGKVFDKWTGSTAYIASTTSATTTVTMPSAAITLTATYKDAVIATHILTVTNGTGDGAYTAGTKVTISANSPATGKVFDKWTGDIDAISERTLSQDGTDITVYQSSVTLTVPNKAITLTANYKDAIATYYLTVTNGTGDGSYVAGTKVTIIANATISELIFDEWTGDTSHIADVNSATTTVTMPSSAITLVATFRESPADFYALDIINGSGDGSYVLGAKATITANTPATGKVFDKWIGDTSYLSSIYTSTATVTMPAKAIMLTATYKDTVATLYQLTVIGGTGSGSYASGADITITAAASATGKVFDKWTGNTSYIASVTSATTTVTMPASTITLTVNYKDAATATYALTVVNGAGGGSYAAGTKVGITAAASATGKVFDKWTGSTAYIASVTSAVTTVTMPASQITVTATYKDKEINYPDGTLIKLATSPKIYVIISGKKKWIPIPEVFEQLGYSWTAIKIVSEDELNKYPDYEDNLIRQIGDTKVYLVVSGIKRHIPNPQVFLGYGFSWNDIKDVDASVIGKYKNTYLIRETKTTSVYYLFNGIRKVIPTAEIFASYNDKWEDVQIISKTEMEAYPVSSLIRLNNSEDVYFVQGTVKKLIPTVTVFNRYQFDWNHVVSVNQTEFDYYQNGGELASSGGVI